MKTWAKVSVSALAGLVVGVAVSVVATSFLMKSYLRVTAAQNAYQDLEFGFERLASRDGVPKSEEKMRMGLVDRLSFSTITLGMQFDRIDDPQLRAGALGIVKLIDANPSLHGVTTQWTERNAAKARQCIIEKFSNPAEVTQCVLAAYESSTAIAQP